MNELVFKGENGQAVTNSLLVAEKFGKNHFDVVRAINEIVKTQNCCLTETQQLNSMFVKSEYDYPLNNGTNAVRKVPMYIMNRDGFSLLVMGFTGKEALTFKLDFISAFNRMEEELRNNIRPDLMKITRKDLAQMLLDSETELERLRRESEEKDRIIDKQNCMINRIGDPVERINRLEHLVMMVLEPLYQARNNPAVPRNRRENTERVESIGRRMEKQCPGSMLVRGMSVRLLKEHNIRISSSDLYQWLRDRGYLLSDPKKCNLPSDESQNRGWMIYSPCGTTIKGQKYFTPYITPKGYEYLAQILKKEKGGLL